MDHSNKKLYRLSELSDYKVESDDPDVTGWEVHDTDGRTIGKVDNLLVNKEIEKVVYLDVEVDPSVIEVGHDTLEKSADEGMHEFENREGEDHLIIPIGMAQLNTDEEYVYADELTHETFAKTNRFKKDAPIDRDYERYIVGRYSGEKSSASSDDDFYDHKAFDRKKR